MTRPPIRRIGRAVQHDDGHWEIRNWHINYDPGIAACAAVVPASAFAWHDEDGNLIFMGWPADELAVLSAELGEGTTLP